MRPTSRAQSSAHASSPAVTLLPALRNGLEELGVPLSPAQARLFQLYTQLLQEWNRRVNLTAIDDAEGVQVHHFLDSATVLPLLPSPLPEGYAALDVGTGAGFPGLPLRILRPELRLALLESVGKKVQFLHALVDALGLAGIQIIHDRAETAAHREGLREAFHLVLARAVAPLATLAELCLPFCLPGGQVIAYKRGAMTEEAAEAEEAMALLGGRLERIEPVSLSAFQDHRVLVVIRKEQPTPPTYPRRAGMPAKRPLGRRAHQRG